jgi:N-acetylmuramoyl-L-alanine amidase
MSVEGVNRSNSTKAKETKTARTSVITVKQGENLKKIAEKFGMTPREFQQWAGLKSLSLQAGQKIQLPMDEVPAHKGLFALAQKYGMKLDELCKLNGITKDYQPAKGEKFYVKNSAQVKETSTPAKTKTETAASNNTETKTAANTEKSVSKKAEQPKVATSTGDSAIENKKKYGSSYTPEELGRQIYQKSCEYAGAVGKPDFDNLVNEINPKNVQEVIENYKGLEHGNESLIKTFVREFSSKDSARKEAVMKVYDALATAKGTDAAKREEFEAELNSQFNSFGMVSTKKLDAMIDEMLKIDTKTNSVSSSSSAKPSKVKIDNRMVIYKEGKKSVSNLQRGAISAAKNEAKEKFAEYCKSNNISSNKVELDLTPMDRIPAPVIDEKGHIKAAESEVLAPTAKSNGKVVILNTGHGGYSTKSGFFDPGTYSFVKKANGKYAPLLEYEKMKKYGDGMVEKLRAQGYSVVLTSGHIQTIQANNSLTNIVNKLNSGKSGKKYTNKDIVFVSLHADSEVGASGTGVLYDSKNTYDSKFASTLNNNLNSQSWISSKAKQRNHKDHKGLVVLMQTNAIPSALVEVEYVNGATFKNLESSAYQAQMENGLVKGINQYFGIEQ